MLELNAPKFPLGTDDREESGRSLMRAAMHHIIKDAIRLGWLECELTMALADVAEEHVITLAQRRAPSLYLVTK